jgi:glycine/D-amino acid oxidase-like deaminating enzyme
MLRLSSRSLCASLRHTSSPRLLSSISSHNQNSPNSTISSVALPTQSRVCIIGGGVIGCSVAYHLAKLGWKDIVLLERGRLSCGTTWHAAGLIGQLRDTETETKLSGVYGAKLLQSLEEETGLSTGFKACGSLTLASNADRVTQLKIRAAKARSFGIEGHLISGKEAGEMYPYLHTDDLHAALWLPGDGSAISSDVTQALARGARLASNGGVRFIENCNVIGISTSHSPFHRSSETSTAPGGGLKGGGGGVNHVQCVHTDQGDIACEVIVNCGGLWARQIGHMCGVSVPLASAEHYYIYSRPFTPPVPSLLPILRDPDAYIYYREWSGGLLMGGFEPVAKPVFEGLHGPPRDFSFSLLPEDWDHFEILMKGALHRTPCLGEAQIKMINGPESFTPDNQYILGEAPEVKGFYVAAGFNSSGWSPPLLLLTQLCLTPPLLFLRHRLLWWSRESSR